MKLHIGKNPDFEIRRESCLSSKAGKFRVMYLSDLHCNSHSAEILSRILSAINELDPDIILLGGDYVDSPKGLKHFRDFIAEISKRNNVFAIAGNHDYYFGIDKIKNAFVEGNINWLEKQTMTIQIKSINITIVGNEPSWEGKNADFKILCLHKPLDIEEYSTNYDMVFAGHLHGCQFVFWENNKGMYPGRAFYRWNMLRTMVGNCSYFISKGLGDTLPIRYNCKKDIILVDIN